MNKFVLIVLIATIFIDLLYILNSSQIFQIFDNTTVYAKIQIGKSSIYRDFKSIPVFGLFSFIVSLIMLLKRNKMFPTWILVANLVIFPFVVLFTFTRSYLIAVLFHIAIVFFAINITSKQKLPQQIMLNITILASLVFLWWSSENIFTTEFSYFRGRIEEVAIKKMEVENLSIRFDYMTVARQLMEKKGKTMTGDGFIRDSYPAMENVGAFAADSTITILFLHTGMIGVGMVYLIWISFTFFAFRNFFKNKDWLVLYIATYGMSTIIVSFLMGTDIRGGIISLMNFALLYVVIHNLWRTPVQATRTTFSMYG